MRISPSTARKSFRKSPAQHNESRIFVAHTHTHTCEPERKSSARVTFLPPGSAPAFKIPHLLLARNEKVTVYPVVFFFTLSMAALDSPSRFFSSRARA